MISSSYNSLPVNLNGEKIYDIVYDGTFEPLSEFIQEYTSGTKRKICVVSDSKVASYHMDAILDIINPICEKVITYVFPEGEQSKNLDTVKALYVELIENKFNRNDLLIALGGGVTGDMCGFAAATYLRGIDFIQIPTSLLADVDSSIGGKTGVDFDSYKNMVGAFHMPIMVLINPNTIKTLSQRQFYSGMGEVVKSALIKNSEFFQWLEENADKLNDFDYDIVKSIIYECNLIKKRVVEEDPTETKGERELLNFGHTIGHAIEKYMKFELLHGECVSIGCILASFISMKKGLIDAKDLERITAYIKNNLHIPSMPADINLDEIIKYTKNDKKATADYIKFVLIDRIGNAVVTKDVTDADMKESLEWYMAEIN